MLVRRLAPWAFTALASLLAVSDAKAQTGPFSNDELLVRSRFTGDSYHTIFRINAVTGVGAPLVDSIFPNYSRGDWMEYDPYRDAVLASMAREPTGVFDPSLFAIDENGVITDLGIGVAGDEARGLAPTGDGRVYCFFDDGLYRIDATNVVHEVPDNNGVHFGLVFDQMHYDAPSNSLIAVSAFFQQASPCYAAGHIVTHRLPLTPDGAALSGPLQCSSFDFGVGVYPMGLDPLPGGDLLLTIAASNGAIDENMMRISMPSLAMSVWSDTDLGALDGGGWHNGLGRTIVLDDISNELRTFGAGQGGTGTFLPVSVPVGDFSTGNSTTNVFADIEIAPGACTGAVIAFGERLAGAGGIEPRLGVDGCPRINGTLTFGVLDTLGGSGGLLAISAATAPFPAVGGTFYVAPPFLIQLPFATGGAPGVAGAGAAVLSFPTPNNASLVGVPFYAQAAISDLAAPQDFALTNAVKLTLGQ